MPCRDRGWERAMRGRGWVADGRARNVLWGRAGGTGLGRGARAREVFVSAGRRDVVYI